MTEITHEALEALRKVEATVEQGGWRALLVMHGEQVVATYANFYETHAPSPENHREADAFIAGWNAALAIRTGQLIHAVPSGDVMEAVEAVAVAERQFANAVWDALRGDHNDLRKQQAIIRAHRSAITACEAARAALGEKP